MNEQERQLITKIFSEYYAEAELDIPGIEHREFGIGNYKKIDARHLSFGSVSDFRRYLTTNTPFFVSHSTSYYDFPGATPIQKKQWKGADVVFDLDIHAEGKYGAYALLDRVKADLVRLVDDFLIGDFGVDEKDLIIDFSGNRGYHVHIRDKRFLPIGAEERRELVDYIMGHGLDYSKFFSDSYSADSRKARLVGPRPEEGGYRGRFARGVIKLLETDPKSISRLFSDPGKREFFISGVKEGNWSKTSLKFDDLVSRLKIVADGLAVQSVDTDAGVTQDLSKLIRVPNTIHGETGLIAKVIDGRGAIEKFEPLRDALIETKTIANETMMILFTEDVPALVLGGENMGPFKKDERREFRLPISMFYVLKGSASIVIR